MRELIDHTEGINRLLARYGVKFGLYKNGTFHEQLFPFDAIPRVIPHEDFQYLEKGLIQRVDALNLFLKDVYGDKKIVKDGVIPEEFVFSSSGYLPECEGIVPPKGIYSHISGIDLVLGKDGEWYILEDNLRIPSGASYPMIAREICRQASPQDYAHIMIALLRHAGIPARYVNGLMIGEGYTHAWVEIYTGEGWYGLDPTNNLHVDDYYIKLAHGRDYKDCILDKGRFLGIAQQKQEIYVKVEEIQ